jgi:cyclophilin family peptidyl-prolyl cis-trans isomerase
VELKHFYAASAVTESSGSRRSAKDRISGLKRLIQPAVLTAAALIAAFASEQTGSLPPGLYANFTTSEGLFTAKLYEKYTPISVANFVGLATGKKAWKDPRTGAMVNRPMYDNITFHRIIRGEMIQSGDPTGTGKHNCGFTIPDEFLIGLRFNAPGRLAVANTGQADSGACQFFITVGTVSRWDNSYTIFGEVVRGMNVVQAINNTPLKGDMPVDPPRLISVRIVRVGPEPKPKTRR